MEQVLDRGGRVLTVREVMSSDVVAIGELLHHLSTRSARQRFLSISNKPGQWYAHELTDALRTMDALVVESGACIIGVGSTHPLADGTVEFAVAVDDEDQGHGIGTVLVEALVTKARQRGVRTMVGTVLGANTQMFDVLRHLGLSYHSVFDNGIANVTLTIAENPAYASAHEARAEEARAAAVGLLLEPSGVAMLAPPSGTRVRGVALARRPEIPVATIERVDGGYEVPVGADLALIPERVRDAAPAALACAQAGVRAIALVGSGPDRLGTRRGRDVLDVSMLERILDAGARVLGPGSKALVNTNPLIRLHVGDERTRVAAGTVAVVTDDSSCLHSLRALLAAGGLGVSAIVDVGRATDLGVGDMVAWFARDSRTEVILVSLGGSAPAGLVHELARVHKAVKPVVLFAVNVSGEQGAFTDNAAEPIRATSLEDLVDLAMLLVLEHRPLGRRVAVVSSSPRPAQDGASRQLARRALTGPDLTQHTEMRIHFLSPWATTRGPVVSLPVDTTPDRVREVLETLLDDPGVDAVVVDHSSSPARRQRALLRLLGGLPGVSSTGEPTPAIVAVGRRGSRHHGSVPVFGTVNDALDAVARTCLRPSA